MKEDKPIKATEATDVDTSAMSGKERAMLIFQKAIDTAMELEKNAPTFQSADEPSLKDNQHKANKFPIDVLHPRLRNIIKEANSTLGFPTDYLAGAMLTAMASAIGNTYAVEHMQGWREYVILFVALVGSPGSNKSHPLSFAMQPLIDFDAEQAASHAEAMKRYNAAMEPSAPTLSSVQSG